MYAWQVAPRSRRPSSAGATAAGSTNGLSSNRVTAQPESSKSTGGAWGAAAGGAGAALGAGSGGGGGGATDSGAGAGAGRGEAGTTGARRAGAEARRAGLGVLTSGAGAVTAGAGSGSPAASPGSGSTGPGEGSALPAAGERSCAPDAGGSSGTASDPTGPVDCGRPPPPLAASVMPSAPAKRAMPSAGNDAIGLSPAGMRFPSTLPAAGTGRAAAVPCPRGSGTGCTCRSCLPSRRARSAPRLHAAGAGSA